MNIQTASIFKKLIFAVIFGAIFWLFLELIQTAFVNLRFVCCERCGDILFDREQFTLAFCAMMSFLLTAFLNFKGWKGVLKTLAVSFLCFQIYFLITKWSALQSDECSALNYPRGTPPLLNEFIIEIVLVIWAFICTAALIVCQPIRRSISTR